MFTLECDGNVNPAGLRGAVEGVCRGVDFIHSPVEAEGGDFRDSALMGKGRVA